MTRKAAAPPKLLPRKKRVARPTRNSVPINLKAVETALAAGCTVPEVAAFVGVDEHTLRRRMKSDADIRDAAERAPALGRAVMRIKLYQKAHGGDGATLRFVAERMLGMLPGAVGGTGVSWLVEGRPQAASAEEWAQQYGPMAGREAAAEGKPDAA